MDRRRLEDLHAKYVELVALRTNALEDAPMRARMRDLAARFPGSLRELDLLPIETLQDRLGAVAAALNDGASEPWMEVLSRYHAGMRLALSLRRDVPERTLKAARVWLHKHALEGVEAEDPARAPGVVDPVLGAALPPLDDESLAALLRPPGGRLHRAVVAWLARGAGGFDDVALEALLCASERGETTGP